MLWTAQGSASHVRRRKASVAALPLTVTSGRLEWNLELLACLGLSLSFRKDGLVEFGIYCPHWVL